MDRETIERDTFESTSKLWKGDTLGTEPVALAVPADGLKQVESLTIDYYRNKLLWIDLNTVWRANLDGTEREQLFSTHPFEQLSGLTVNTLGLGV